MLPIDIVNWDRHHHHHPDPSPSANHEDDITAKQKEVKVVEKLIKGLYKRCDPSTCSFPEQKDVFDKRMSAYVQKSDSLLTRSEKVMLDGFEEFSAAAKPHVEGAAEVLRVAREFQEILDAAVERKQKQRKQTNNSTGHLVRKVFFF